MLRIQSNKNLNIADKNTKWYSNFIRNCLFLISHYPTTPLLGIYPREMEIYVHPKAYMQIFTTRNNPKVLHLVNG